MILAGETIFTDRERPELTPLHALTIVEIWIVLGGAVGLARKSAVEIGLKARTNTPDAPELRAQVVRALRGIRTRSRVALAVNLVTKTSVAVLRFDTCGIA